MIYKILLINRINHHNLNLDNNNKNKIIDKIINKNKLIKNKIINNLNKNNNSFKIIKNNNSKMIKFNKMI